MTAVTAIHLRDEIIAIMNSTKLTTPQEIADEVMRLVNRDNAVDAVSQMITGYVRGVLGEQRKGNMPAVSPEDIRRAGSNRSSKVSAIRDGWQRHLESRVHVEAGHWKMFRDLTEADLRYAARERRSNAERNLLEAHRYEAWAQLVAEYGADTFSDLPLEVQMRALGTAA